MADTSTATAHDFAHGRTQPHERSRAFGASALHAWLPVLLFYSLLIPAGLSAEFGGFRMYGFRAFLIVSVPFAIYAAFSRPQRLILADYAMIAYLLWTCASFVILIGVSGGLEAFGRDAIDIGFAYLIGRVTLVDIPALRQFLRRIMPAVLVIGVLIFIESVTGSFRLLNVFPLENAYGSSLNEYRLGFLRAFGPFSHAILGGTLLTSLAILFAVTSRHRMPRILGSAGAILGIFTLSSAAVLGLIVQVGAFVYRFAMRFVGFRIRWATLAWLGAALFVALEIISGGDAIRVVIRLISLNSGTGFYRLLIWEYGSQTALANPIFGIAYEEYTRPAWMGSSIDNNWLAVAVRNGIPAVIFALIAHMSAMAQNARASHVVDGYAGRVHLAAFTWLLALFFIGITVYFFNEFRVFYYLFLGCFASLGQRAMDFIKSASRQPPVPEQEAPPVRA